MDIRVEQFADNLCEVRGWFGVPIDDPDKGLATTSAPGSS